MAEVGLVESTQESVGLPFKTLLSGVRHLLHFLELEKQVSQSETSQAATNLLFVASIPVYALRCAKVKQASVAVRPS